MLLRSIMQIIGTSGKIVASPSGAHPLLGISSFVIYLDLEVEFEKVLDPAF